MKSRKISMCVSVRWERSWDVLIPSKDSLRILLYLTKSNNFIWKRNKICLTTLFMRRANETVQSTTSHQSNRNVTQTSFVALLCTPSVWTIFFPHIKIYNFVVCACVSFIIIILLLVVLTSLILKLLDCRIDLIQFEMVTLVRSLYARFPI